MPSDDDLVAEFEENRLDPAAFSHRDHLRAAHGMLAKYDFVEATARYSDAIRGLAVRAGAGAKFNVTVTIAFLGLIAERMASAPDEGFDGFLASNPDLLERDALARWYSPERLGSEIARRQFVLPDRAA